MKLESLVIAGQLYRGEYVLKSCTHNKSAQQVILLRRSNRLPRFVDEAEPKDSRISREMLMEDLEAEDSRTQKAVVEP